MAPHFQFSVPIQIRMSDLDPFAHVNNGAQCHYFDYGRSNYLEHVLQMTIDWTTFDLVLVHVGMDFKDSIGFHDQLVCESRVTAIGNKSFRMEQQLRDLRTDKVKTTCECVLAGLDRHALQAIPIQEEYKAKFRAFEHLDD
ncbi:MAG: acyl-CoA thioesterase [Bacteroidales bacterium]|nr:acyl-CoA thioesterase [Bacteroidales bacterium]